MSINFWMWTFFGVVFALLFWDMVSSAMRRRHPESSFWRWSDSFLDYLNSVGRRRP